MVDSWEVRTTITMQLYHQFTKFCVIFSVGVIMPFVIYTDSLCQLFQETAYVIQFLITFKTIPS